MIKCPRCGYEFDLKRSNKLEQIIDYLATHNEVKLPDLMLHFTKKWSCSNNAVTNALRKLGREKIIKVENERIYITDEWLLKQKKL
ncbi:MAG: hypothetical protein QXU67_06950 [Candidatus Bathyarchaeia archaeon]